MPGRDILLVTQPPFEGGVPHKARLLCRHLIERGHRVTLAWYATFKYLPELNVPIWRLGRSKPAIRAVDDTDGLHSVAVGSYLPELEAPYYLPSSRWRQLVASHDRHVAVGGPPLIGHVLTGSGIPYLVWCASDMASDRADRQKAMPWPRRIVDKMVTRPWLRQQQAAVLRGCTLALGVSDYSRRRLVAVGGDPERVGVLPIPVDLGRFVAQPGGDGSVLGFAGRFEDPRKNIDLLLLAVAHLRHQGLAVRLRLAGTEPSPGTRRKVAELGLSQAVDFAGELPVAELPGFYGSLDALVIPSHQEGLCITGIEAMACRVPVVATRCGGPQDYVKDGVTGALCDFDVVSMAEAIRVVLVRRRELGQAALDLVHAEYSMAAFGHRLAEAWRRVWGEEP